MDSYRRFGFGLYLASLRDGGLPIGICGLVKRDDPARRRCGLRVSVAILVAGICRGIGRRRFGPWQAQQLHLPRIVAITAPDNHGSIAVLEKIGLRFERMVRLTENARNSRCSGPRSTLDPGHYRFCPMEYTPCIPFLIITWSTPRSRPDGDVPLSAEGVRVIESAPPKEFDGPGNQWSPEGLLTAAVADCFVLGFRAIAAASKYAWLSLEWQARGARWIASRARCASPIRHARQAARAAGRGHRTGEEAARKGGAHLPGRQFTEQRAPSDGGSGRLVMRFAQLSTGSETTPSLRTGPPRPR